MNRANFKNEVKNYARPLKENIKELGLYIDAIFRRHAIANVLRIDLYYRDDASSPPTAVAPLNLEAVRRHRKIFLKGMREKLLRDALLGYVWKLEYIPGRSFRYHTLVFLGDTDLGRDVETAQLIGNYWVKAVTNGAGSYHVCDVTGNPTKHQGTGIIKREDRSKIANLKQNAGEYMTGPDSYVRPAIFEGARTFGKGVMPKALSAEQTTAPRRRRLTSPSGVIDL